MDERTRAELQDLRARAYGRHPGGGLDAVQSARLEQLEGMLRPAADAAQAIAAPPPTIAAMPSAPEVRAPSLSVRAQAAQFWRNRPLVILWAASVVVPAVAVGIAVAHVAGEASASAPAGRVHLADLRVPTDEPWVSEWMGAPADLETYGFSGLTVAHTASDHFFGDGSDCLYVVDGRAYEPDDQIVSGPVYSGCRAGAFPPTVQFEVDTSFPPELLERVAVGTALTFVLDDEVISVYSDGGPQAPR